MRRLTLGCTERLEENVKNFFSFKMPSPSIAKDYVEKAIERYEQRTQKERKEPITEKSFTFWLAGKIIVLTDKDGRKKLCWTFMQSEERLSLPSSLDADTCADLLYSLRPSCVTAQARKNALAYLSSKLLLKLRGRGLCVMPHWNVLQNN